MMLGSAIDLTWNTTFLLARCGETSYFPLTASRLAHWKEQCWLKVDRNRLEQKRRTKSQPFTFQTWVLGGRIAFQKALWMSYCSKRVRFVVRRLKHDGIACVNRCRVATASLRPRPLPAGSHTEACRSICQDAAQAHP